MGVDVFCSPVFTVVLSTLLAPKEQDVNASRIIATANFFMNIE